MTKTTIRTEAPSQGSRVTVRAARATVFFLAVAATCMSSSASSLHREGTVPLVERLPQHRFVYKADGKRLSDLLADFAASEGVPAIVGEGVTGTVFANFDATPSDFLDAIAKAYGLVWYFDGTALYFSPANQMRSRIFRLNGFTKSDVETLLASLGIGDPRFALRFDRQAKTLLVYGPPRHVELVGSVIESLDTGAQEGNRREARVFPLRYASAADRTMGNTKIAGVATVLRGVFSRNDPAKDPFGSMDPLSNPDGRVRVMQALQGGNRLIGAVNNEMSKEQGVLAAAAVDKSGAPGRGLRSPVDYDEDDPTFTPDEGTNSVIVNGRARRMADYAKLIQQIDVPPTLIELEAVIIDVRSDEQDSLGVDWTMQGPMGTVSLVGPAVAGASAGSNLPVGGFSLGALVADAGQVLLARIKALEAHGKARIVARPKIVGLSNRAAMLGDKSIANVRVAGNLEANLFQVEAGTRLLITPQVLPGSGDGAIKLSIYIEDGEFRGDQVDNIPIVRKSELRTEASVPEGESLLIGGIVVDSNVRSQGGVPGLSRIPGLGGIFRWKDDRSTRSERLFLITPRRIPSPAAGVPVTSHDGLASPLPPALSLSAPVPTGAPASVPAAAAMAPATHEVPTSTAEQQRGLVEMGRSHASRESTSARSASATVPPASQMTTRASAPPREATTSPAATSSPSVAIAPMPAASGASLPTAAPSAASAAPRSRMRAERAVAEGRATYSRPDLWTASTFPNR